MIRNRLIIFVKAPLMAKAKTRLAADIGYVHAQRLYKAMTAELLRNVSSDKWETILAVTPKRWLNQIPIWNRFAQYPQISGSLSPRLAQAFSRKGKTIVIGSDCPQITRADIQEAFAAIKPNRPVYGPAHDGGFWLIGATAPVKPAVFDNVRWSTEFALEDMARNMEYSPHYLRELIDVDDLEALRAVRKQGRHT